MGEAKTRLPQDNPLILIDLVEAGNLGTIGASSGARAGGNDGAIEIMKRRILIIEDEVCLARNIRRYLTDVGFEARACHDGGSGLEEAVAFRPDTVLLDLQLPDLDGLVVLKRLRMILPAARVIMLTACDNPRAEAEAIGAGACGYKLKPIALNELRRTVADVR